MREGSSECKVCERGTYNVNFTSDRCFPCPAGFDCFYNNVQPKECDAGTYSALGSTHCKGVSLDAFGGIILKIMTIADFCCYVKAAIQCELGMYSMS